MLKKIFTVLRNVLENPLQLLRGIVEFIVNALSKTISQIYNLARNIFDLANNGWQLYKGAQTISREELVRKVSETVIVSGSLMIWDSLDLILEKWLVAQTGGALAPFSPYISAAVTAIGFGISTHALQGFVTRIIDAVIAFKCGYVEQLETERAACEQLIIVAENELTMIGDLGEYIGSELKVFAQMEAYTRTLSIHEPIQPIDPFSLHMTAPDARKHSYEHAYQARPFSSFIVTRERHFDRGKPPRHHGLHARPRRRRARHRIGSKAELRRQRKVGALMSNLESRGWWGQVTSGLSGGTDKELAILVQDWALVSPSPRRWCRLCSRS